jgi:hypothetical protein
MSEYEFVCYIEVALWCVSRLFQAGTALSLCVLPALLPSVGLWCAQMPMQQLSQSEVAWMRNYIKVAFGCISWLLHVGTALDYVLLRVAHVSACGAHICLRRNHHCVGISVFADDEGGSSLWLRMMLQLLMHVWACGAQRYLCGAQRYLCSNKQCVCMCDFTGASG